MLQIIRTILFTFILEPLPIKISPKKSTQPEKTNGIKAAKNDVVDFEELIDNFNATGSTIKTENGEQENGVKSKLTQSNDKPIIETKTLPPETTISLVKSNNNNNNPAMLLQNQNLLDIALLNNSLITASLAMSPTASTSKEALTATALILNYNSQIINTLSNNFQMPYNNSNNTNLLLFPQSFCDKIKISNSNQLMNVRRNDNNLDDMIEEVTEHDEKATTSSLIHRSEQSTAEKYYKQLLTYCKALPKWYDVNYAYSGLHTIVNIPPTNANLWDSDNEYETQVKRPRRSTSVKQEEVECKFCYETYEHRTCQFYRPYNQEFKVKIYRSEKLILCECCDFTEDEEDEQTEDDGAKIITDDKIPIVRAGWFGKGKQFVAL